MEIEKIKKGNRFSGTNLLETTLIIHKAAIIASEKRIRETLRYKVPSALRRGRRIRIMDSAIGKPSCSSLSKPVFSFKVSDKSRLYSTKKTVNVKTDIATVSGIVDKG
jgi:hypothetical protein